MKKNLLAAPIALAIGLLVATAPAMAMAKADGHKMMDKHMSAQHMSHAPARHMMAKQTRTHRGMRHSYQRPLTVNGKRTLTYYW